MIQLKEKIDRRNLFLTALKMSGQLAVANLAVYSISLISNDQPFGGLTAGAKCSPGPCTNGQWLCPSGTQVSGANQSVAHIKCGGVDALCHCVGGVWDY